MSETRQKLMNDMKEYMKAGDKERLAVVRMVITEIKNAEINDPKDPGRQRSEEEVMNLIGNYHKTLTKSLADYPADKHGPIQSELKIVESYMPKRLSPEDVKAFVSKELAGNPERNFGVLMKAFQAKIGQQTDGKTLSESIKSVLAQLGA